MGIFRGGKEEEENLKNGCVLINIKYKELIYNIGKITENLTKLFVLNVFKLKKIVLKHPTSV